jgi:BTB/POZ domain
MVDVAELDSKSDSTDECGSWYENETHQNGVLEMMKLMYDSHQLTDVCVTVDSQHFFCHRAVLAATSCYFHAMFTSNLAESRQADIQLHEVDADSVGALINYAYTGRVCITRLNVQNLMFTASLFQVTKSHSSLRSFHVTFFPHVLTNI